MKINILGTVYDYQETTAKEDTRLDGNDGYCDRYEKTIRIETDYNENSVHVVKDINKFRQNVKRHEIVHGYLYESGMREWCDNELFVDWIAIMAPKLVDTFKETGAL